MKKILVLLILACHFFVYSNTQDLLKSSDISRIMQQILSQHVGDKELSLPILQEAFQKYIEQFDSKHVYLLQKEVDPYFQLSQDQLKKILDQYKNNDFSAFEKLNETIQISIIRSRKIRNDLEKIPFRLAISDSIGSGAFANTEEQLRNRIAKNLNSFNEAEKKSFENQYLFQNEDGTYLSAPEQLNLFALHVLKALASSLDSHTSFYKTNEAFDLKMRLQKEFQGIGIVLKDKQEGVTVAHMLEGGPAERSHLIENGDILIAIDDQSIIGIPFEKAIEKLHGDKDKDVKLTLKRNNQIISAQLTRENIILKNDRVDVREEAFGNGIIGIVQLHGFYQGEGVSSEQDVRNAIEKLKQKGPLKGLILDLRDNSGGFLSQAVKVAGLFITDGIIVISKYSNGEEKIYRDVDGKTLFAGPMIVLTSKATASAAEIVAQALQDYGVALVVGDERTYGKGTIQTQTVTDNQSSSYFKVTVGKYYTVSGKTPQKEGVKADIVVPSHWHKEKIGEVYLDSLENDVIAPYYNDKLKDVPPDLRSWYIKYYIPKLQRRSAQWRDMIPNLRKNSEYRIAHNKNYQFFLKGSIPEEDADADLEDEWGEERKNKTYGEDDLQVQEAVNILKDMIFMENDKK